MAERAGGRVDLEALAEAYRHRPAHAANLEHARRALAGARPGGVALDVGGGPGAHAEVFAEGGMTAVLVDPSRGMVRSAARRVPAAVRAVAQQLPFRDGTVDLVYFHLSLHYGDWRRATDEALRVLRPGGSVWIWTLGPRHHRRSMLARWFPSVEGLDRGRFPEPEAVAARLGRLAEVRHGHERATVRRRVGDWRDAVEAGFVSTLQLIDAGELQAGLASFDAEYPDPDGVVAYDMYWEWLHAVPRPLR